MWDVPQLSTRSRWETRQEYSKTAEYCLNGGTVSRGEQKKRGEVSREL